MNTRKLFNVVVASLLSLASICSAVEGTWTRKADMPTARLGLTTSTVNGKIYAIGGGNSIDGTAFRTVEEYDPATDTWTRKADMSMPRFFHCAGVVNGKIYIIGGATGPNLFTSMVEEYDPATDTWQRKSSMPTVRGMLVASVLGDKIYVIGGAANAQTSISVVEQYDPQTDTWTKKADMPTDRSMLSASAVDGRIYAVGGLQGWIGGAGIATVEEYDPITNTWTTRADMPTSRKMLSTLVMAGKIIAIGGGTAVYGPAYSAVEEYDLKTDTWTKKSDMPTARWFISTSEANGSVYVIGGSLGDPHVAVSILEEYTLIPPSPDFNGDGMVDIKDLLRLIGSWNQDDSLLDIAPPPFGDGIVDALDLELLMNYWEQPFDDPTLLAHWALDETEGIIAYDSTGICDAYINGDPVWLPGDGMVDGALMLNGINDYAFAPLSLSPSGGPFSTFAWIKGGTPGQVIFSQSNGANWLGADSSFGCLMTELIPPVIGRSVPQPLISESVITDEQWHRIGFVWDGTNRALYVDDILVAEDTQANLQNSDGGLYIGTGKAMELGTYWSGLIDDVRIYNRAVRP
jgi:N-acetylneuraminic acid mutarotase